ncbi:LIM and calponin homology domains-containing protein 1-like isoform X2 [Mugil cephalus]|uniref:LIM and calponin homology domains-containing protein 1-like isoform X2 n=1 Tax=Mugil cephalus TaxID=48193 RepID=UPI001FB7E02E|nr:LIM and calponin homology domains-containing protein 1-like isoform X2 [Mugil cephalus]
MASPGACRDPPSVPETPEPSHPEPACQEAQKWIEAVTGKDFGEKDFRSALENGILLCELLSAIKPGLVKKINRLPTPIAGLDNLSVFLRGCEELGLKGSQLFDPGDLQDTSMRANLKDSDCNRKLKNVLNTVFWLGKAASGCASYSGPTLNLKEFEGLLAQMKVETEEGGDSPQKRSVRDSGYDCWDSERSDSLSPPRHTRDNSLDSLDSFGSRSQHSPSPDVVNRGNSDGRGSDSEADAPSRKPDVRKDDMLARRTASGESRHSIPFNQFLPNRTNVSSYIPAPRRKTHTEEGEQRSHPQEPGKRTGPQHKTPKTVTWALENNGEKTKQEEEVVTQDVLEQRRLQKLEKAGIKVLPAAVRYSSPPATEEKAPRSPSPNIILRCDNEFLSSQKSAWDSCSDGEEEAEVRKVPDVRKDDLASRRARRGPVAPRVHQFVPPPSCSSKDRERWEGIRRASQQTLQEKEKEKEISEKEAVPDIITRRDNPFLNSAPRREEEEDEEEVGEEGKVKVMPNKQKDDLARRRAQSRPLPHRDGPMSFVSSSMSWADMQKWERLKMTEPSEASPAPVCQDCLEKNYGGPFSGSAKAGRGHSKVVTFGGVTEIEKPIGTLMSSEGEETESLRRLLSKATVAMPTIRLGSQLSERERSQVDGADPDQTAPTSAELPPRTPDAPPTPAEIDARLAQYEQRAAEEEEDDDEEEERIPDLQKDDMMARRTGVFHKQISAPGIYNRFLPLPGSKRCIQGEVTTDAAPRNKKEVQSDRSKKLNVRTFCHRAEDQQPKIPMETPQQQLETTVVRATSRNEREYDNDEDEYDENEPVPDPEKDDMMARRTRLFNKASAPRTNQGFNQFLPLPGSVKYTVSPVSAMKPLHSRPKVTEKVESESNIVTVAAEAHVPTSKAPTGPSRAGLREKLPTEEKHQMGEMLTPNATVTLVAEPPSSPPLIPPPVAAAAVAAAQTCRVEVELEKKRVEERVEVEEKKTEINEKQEKPFWLEDDELPPMMMSRRVAFMSEDTESVSLGDMNNEDEVGHLPSLSQSRHERMHEQFNNFQEEEDHWQSDLVRWKNRRRSASQDLIKKEEERKRMEKRMKDEGGEGNKRKSIKTYKEIVEEKERREAELCIAYRNAATPEEAALVLQRYALRFTISDATLDSLKLPRSTAKPKQDLNQVDQEHELTSPDEKEHNETSPDEKEHKPTSPVEEEHKPASSIEEEHKPTSPVEEEHKPTSPVEEEHKPTSPVEEEHKPTSPIDKEHKPTSPVDKEHKPTSPVDKEHKSASPVEEEHKPTLPIDNHEMSDYLHKPESTVSEEKHTKPEDTDTSLTDKQKNSAAVSTSPPPPPESPPSSITDSQNVSPQPLHLSEAQTQLTESVTTQSITQIQVVTGDAQLQTQHASPLPTKPARTLPPAPPVSPRPVPLLVAKPYCQPRSTMSGHKPVRMDGLVRVNGEAVEDLTVSTPPPSHRDSPLEVKAVSSKQTEEDVQPVEAAKSPETAEQLPPPQKEKPAASSGSAISSLIGGRNCIITTTIVTELTQTHIEPLHPESQSNGQVATSNLYERPAEENNAQPTAPPSSMQDYSPTVTEGLEESSVTEQYQREQEKLKKEWEKAQLEVQEEERKHNEEERRILEETVAPLNPTGLVTQPSEQTVRTSSAPESNSADSPLQHNGQRISMGNEDQHASKLHFFQDSSPDSETSKKELWKTSSLDRNPQLNQAQIVKRSGSHDGVTTKQQCTPSTQQPPSPSRCVSGKRLCSGCSQPLGKGAAMIIDTLGLFFHMQCFKCGVCKGQLGDATAGTDVRIRNGLLSCHECYIASRGRGQPTTL